MSLTGEAGSRRWMRWVPVAALIPPVSAVFVAVGLPAPFLFAGLVAGAVPALASRTKLGLHAQVQGFGLGMVGIAAGASIDVEVLRTVASQPLTVLGCVAATLLITAAAGQLLRLSPHISGPTAMFSSIAGAASGVTAVVREVGGDDAIVMTIQYFRVIAVMLSVPPMVAWLSDGPPPAASAGLGWTDWDGLVFTLTALVIGTALSAVLSFSASRLMWPLVAGTGLSISGVFEVSAAPPVMLYAGYAIIGIMVGVSLTPTTLRVLVKIMPLAILQLAVSLVLCAGVGLAIGYLTPLSLLDGYLAATPGGLPAVTAIALGSGANVGVVITTQLVRVFLALGLATLLGEIYTRRQQTEALPDAPPA